LGSSACYEHGVAANREREGGGIALMRDLVLEGLGMSGCARWGRGRRRKDMPTVEGWADGKVLAGIRGWRLRVQWIRDSPNMRSNVMACNWT
jgi:hypothetical protein